jgi:hypothetical protein
MIVTKDIFKKVSVDYFFVKGKLEIDSEYFISKIKEGCALENAMSFKTNIKGLMTPYNHFVEDKKFISLIQPLIDFVDDNYDNPNYHLWNAWGHEVRQREKTAVHSHSDALWSGVIYLNSSNQLLDFPQIKEQIKPEEGTFAIFSPFLKHGCSKNTDPFSKFGLSFNFQKFYNG